MLWGLYFFLFIVVEKAFLLRVLSKDRIVSHIYLVLIVYFGWILFRFSNVSDILDVLRGMFGLNGNPLADFETVTLFKSNVFIIVFCAVVSTPVIRKLGNMVRYTYMDKKGISIIYAVGRIVIPLLLLIISTAALVGDSYNPFLYFQF